MVLAASAAVAAGGFVDARPAGAEALLLVDVDTGKVLEGENATYPWYPASVTKLMTTYVTFKAIRDRRIKFDTMVTVSPNAVAQSPSKMGFKSGTQLTVDNALKMLLVHSANDMAVVLAEGVSGSIDKFADEMNAAARRLGMTQTNYVNPNGLPADEQVTSARDLAILARALIREYPEYSDYWHIPSIRLGKRVYRNTNRLIDVYPGADGMKTGFICASGFNLVGTATRNDKRLIAVVLGAPSSSARALKAAQMLERGFSPNPLSWLLPSLGNVEALVPVAAAPPNLRDDICGKKNQRAPSDDDGEGEAAGPSDDPGGQHAFLLSSLRGAPKPALLTSGLTAAIPPVDVYIGPPHGPGAATAPSTARNKPNAVAAKLTATPPPAKPGAAPDSAGDATTPPAPDAPNAALGLKPWPGTVTAAPATETKPAVVAAKPKKRTAPKPTRNSTPKTDAQ